MFYRIEKINVLKNKKIEIKFNTGEIKIFSLKEYIKKLKILKRHKELKKVKVHKNGYEIIWPNGIEISSNILYKNSNKNNVKKCLKN